jgi:hypothetical protein
LADLPDEEIQRQADLEAVEAIKILRRLERDRVRAWADWMRLADILFALRRKALHLSGTNFPGSRGYNKVMGELLRNHPELRNSRVLTNQVQAALIGIAEHRAAVEDMRAKWDPADRYKWSAPTTVWDRFRRRKKGDDPRSDEKGAARMPPQSQRDRAHELQAQVDGLHEETARLRAVVAERFADLDSQEWAALIRQHLGPQGISELIAALTALDHGKVDDGWPVEALCDDTDAPSSRLRST